jgi:predicted metal-dependent hydrolase
MFYFRIRRRRKRRPAHNTAQYREHKEAARAFVHTRLAHWSAVLSFPYNQVRIKNTRRMWGSCSGKQNLNFNWRVLRLPPDVADYIIVHELCHLKEHNHSARFWQLVKEALPNYQELRMKLRLERMDE